MGMLVFKLGNLGDLVVLLVLVSLPFQLGQRESGQPAPGPETQAGHLPPCPPHSLVNKKEGFGPDGVEPGIYKNPQHLFL